MARFYGCITVVYKQNFMSLNLFGAYCIYSAKESKYDSNIIIRSNSCVTDVYYVCIKNWIKEKKDLLFVTSTEYKFAFA